MLPASLLPQNSPIVLFRMDEPFNRDTISIWLVRNEIFLEAPDTPQPNARMLSFAYFAENAHLRHTSKVGVRPLDGLAKALGRFEAGVFNQVSVVDDEILPRSGALYGPRHDLW